MQTRSAAYRLVRSLDAGLIALARNVLSLSLVKGPPRDFVRGMRAPSSPAISLSSSASSAGSFVADAPSQSSRSARAIFRRL
jgi:hypothetical protein